MILPAAQNGEPASLTRSIRRHMIAGAATLALLAGGLGGWGATARLSAAVIAPGHLVVESNVKKVQHPTGGVVGQLLVDDGDRVQAGDVLIRLDETQARAHLAILTKSLDELRARQARLRSEQEGLPRIAFPTELSDRISDPQIGQLLSGEERLFETRRQARQGKQAQLRERIARFEEETVGLTAQIAAKKRELALIQEELVGVRDLWEKKLVPITRVVEMERTAARLEGERGQLISARAQARGRIAETELEIIQIDQDLRSEVGRELAEIRAKLAELEERKVAAEDVRRRIDIRAPQNGTVHQLSVHTVGGVISPGETIMHIVPKADALSMEATVPPSEIDRISVGQHATLRFSALNQRTTPEITGTVSRVSADVSTDERLGTKYYTLRIVISPGELARLGDVTLIPGMPVEAFVETGSRTVISYLAKPLVDQLSRSFRDD